MTTEAIEIPEIGEMSNIIENTDQTLILVPNQDIAAPITPKSIKRIAPAIVSVVSGLLALSLAVGYFMIANYFSTHFLPNTVINGINVSHMTAEEVTNHIFEQTLTYQIEVFDQNGDIAGIINAHDIGTSIDIDVDIRTLLTNQNEYKWIFEYSNPSVSHFTYDIDFEHNQLSKLIRNWAIFDPLNMERPQNAYISEYNSALKGYELIAETPGNVLDFMLVKEALTEAIIERKSQINIAEENCYIRAKTTADDRNLIRRASVLNLFTGTKITYDWNGSEVILDGDLIHLWIIEAGGRFSLDAEAVREFVNYHAKENDTFGKKRNFTTTQGVTKTLPGGGYGWRTDRAGETASLIELISAGAVTEREPEYIHRGWSKGADDIGPSYVEIDLSNQRLYLYDEGEIILESDLVSGCMARGWGTPAGVFGLTYKERNAVLRGANYRTPVNYWMPFNGNIGMHDAKWRGSFGGDIFMENGSHGCINLPQGKAKEIYEHISKGFPVICYY